MRTTFPGPFPAGSDVKLHAAQDGNPPQEITVPASLLSPDIHFREPPQHVQSHDIAAVMAGFVAAIRGQGKPSPDFEQAYHVEAVLEAARISIMEKRWAGIIEIPA